MMKPKPHDGGVYETPMPDDLKIIGDDFAPLDDAKAKAAMPRDCPTPKTCREHCCHGACLPVQMDGFVKPMPALDILQRLREERDLCASEHADDIANLLHETVLYITALRRFPLDPLRIEELWDEANEAWGSSIGGPDEHVLFARAIEREHGIGA